MALPASSMHKRNCLSFVRSFVLLFVPPPVPPPLFSPPCLSLNPTHPRLFQQFDQSWSVHASVFIIGVFGESKPSSCPQYLAEFMNEYTAVRNTGFQLLGRNVKLKITTVICDAQARAFVKCVKQLTTPTAVTNAAKRENLTTEQTMFLGQNAERRTDASFRKRKDKDNHQMDKTRNYIISPFKTAGLGVLRRVYVYAAKWMTCTVY